MRNILFGGLLVFLASPGVAEVHRTAGGGIDSQAFAWVVEEATTASTEWERIEGLSVDIGCFRQSPAASATVSIDARASAPFKVRVVTRGVTNPSGEGRKMLPRAATFTPASAPLSGRDSFSFTFVHPFPENDHGTSFDVEWRSPSGSTVTIESGTLHVLWDDIERDRLCI